MQVEREEEYLTNTLQKQLDQASCWLWWPRAKQPTFNAVPGQVLQEKNAMQQQLEREKEYVANELQGEIAALKREKARLQAELDGMRADKITLENQLEQEQECMLNRYAQHGPPTSPGSGRGAGSAG